MICDIEAWLGLLPRWGRPLDLIFFFLIHQPIWDGVFQKRDVLIRPVVHAFDSGFGVDTTSPPS